MGARKLASHPLFYLLVAKPPLSAERGEATRDGEHFVVLMEHHLQQVYHHHADFVALPTERGEGGRDGVRSVVLIGHRGCREHSGYHYVEVEGSACILYYSCSVCFL